jgi:hypothetical protein
MERASGDFVKSLRDEIELRKKIKNYERSLLTDSINFIISILEKNQDFELVSLKNFKTNELSSIADISFKKKNPFQQIEKFLNSENLFCEFQKIEDNLSVCYLDLSGKIEGYREKPNLVVLQFLLKSQGIIEIKIFPKSESPIFSFFENSYFFIKIWIFDSGIFQTKKIDIKADDRNKLETYYPLDEKMDVKINFHETGEISQINIFQKKGEKD